MPRPRRCQPRRPGYAGRACPTPTGGTHKSDERSEMAIQYRADQVGSLLRPQRLLEGRAARAAGKLSQDELRRLEDEAILAALEMQRRAGVEVFVDGEFRRHAWQTDMADAVEGFVEESLPIAWRGPSTGPEPSSARVVAGKLEQRRRLTAHESAFLKAHAAGPFKITIPSPSVFMT